MATWHLDAHAVALFDRLNGDPAVRDLLGDFQDATGVRIWLAPLSPPSLEDIVDHARGHPFCRAFVAVSEQARAHCLCIHSSLRMQPLKPGGVVRQCCAAGILHAALPLSVANKPVALLLIGGLHEASAEGLKAGAKLRRFLEKQDGMHPSTPVSAMVCKIETRSAQQINALVRLVNALASLLETRALHLETSPENALPDLMVPSVISRKAGVSERRLRGLFQTYFRMTLTEWLARQRVFAAMALLRDGGDRIVDIAYSCGFSAASSFYRVFRQETGITPSDYRKGAKPRVSASLPLPHLNRNTGVFFLSRDSNR